MPETTFKSERKVLREELKKKFPRERGQLLPALHYLQHKFGYLPEWGMEVVGWHLAIPASEVYGAATSYTELRTQEPGNHLIRVCSGLGCWVNGGGDILRDLSSTMGIQPAETTADNKFTLEETSCTYICAMAPVVEIDGQLIGRASCESVAAFVEEIKNNG
ncbi:MAG: NAD(P)H-dependent oxidoreductase subunit E [SAR202 cluster bacterium]|nr:NAD(P)H-dependent oxidoreductase subunit E [SAR202 cluster bacterium]